MAGEATVVKGFEEAGVNGTDEGDFVGWAFPACGCDAV